VQRQVHDQEVVGQREHGDRRADVVGAYRLRRDSEMPEIKQAAAQMEAGSHQEHLVDLM